MKPTVVILVLSFFVVQAKAVTVPGTSVDIKPPPGFVIADRFPGLMNKETGSSNKIAKSYRVKKVTETSVGSDKELNKLIIGEWKSELRGDDFEIRGTNKYSPNGELVFRAKMKIPGQEIEMDVEGKWVIENGVIVSTVTKTTNPEILPKGTMTRNKIIKLDSEVLKYRDEDGDILTEYRIISKKNR